MPEKVEKVEKTVRTGGVLTRMNGRTTVIMAIIGLCGTIVTGAVTVLTYNKAQEAVVKTAETHVLVNSQVDAFKKIVAEELSKVQSELASVRSEMERKDAAALGKAEERARSTPTQKEKPR